MLIFLLILMVLVAILILVLASPIRVSFKLDDSVTLSLSFLFFKYNFFNKNTDDTGTEDENDNPFEAILKKIKSPKNLLEFLNSAKMCVNFAIDFVVAALEIMKKTKLKKIDFSAEIGGSEPQNAVFNYAKVSALIYGAAPLLFEINEPESYFISVMPKPFSKKDKINFEISASVRLIFVVIQIFNLFKMLVFSKKYSYIRNLRRSKNYGKNK